MKKSGLFLVYLLPLLASCQLAPMPGSGRDVHGCLMSAGYQWCPQTGRCERYWELAEALQMDKDSEQIDAYCVGLPAGTH